MVRGTTLYAYGEPASIDCDTKVSFYGKDSRKVAISEVDCECIFIYRMKLPFRHSIALAMYVDRDSMESGNFLTNKVSQTLESLLTSFAATRWLFSNRSTQ